MTAASSSTTAGGGPARRAPASTEPSAPALGDAMRRLPAGVCVISIGEGAERTGLTATSVSALSTDPPTLLVSVNRASSSYQASTRRRAFGANALAADRHAVANSFSGRERDQGAERYAAGRWLALNSGVCMLSDVVAAFDCEVEERSERHFHAIVIGRVRGRLIPGGRSALVYRRGEYDQLGWTDEEVSRPVGLQPCAPRPTALAADASAPMRDEASASPPIAQFEYGRRSARAE